MSDTPDSPEQQPIDPTMRLVPLSDIDAFVEVRAGSIIDEAAVLAIQFLGERDVARQRFVAMAMERFDKIGAVYDDLRVMAMYKARIAQRRADLEARKAAETKPPEPTPEPGAGEPEKKE